MAWAMPAIKLSAQNFRDSVELDPIVVTASHTPKALKDAPVVTRLITRHDIKITDATNIQDMLTQEIPGLEFGFAMTQETSLNMSGFGGNAVLFLVDGERMAGETMDNTDYNRMNLDNVGRIEIVKGASSALYGSNAVGGVAQWGQFLFQYGEMELTDQLPAYDDRSCGSAEGTHLRGDRHRTDEEGAGAALRRVGTQRRLEHQSPLRTKDLQRERTADVARHRPADTHGARGLLLPYQRARYLRLSFQGL